jgi:hypothetical protein
MDDFFVICETKAGAEALAEKVHAGELPNVYPSEEGVRGAWANQPSPMQRRYHIWKCRVEGIWRTHDFETHIVAHRLTA